MPRYANRAFGSKPIVGSQIDWTNPITRRLVGCWLLNEGGGGVAKDLTKRLGNATRQNNMPFDVSPYGKCILGDDTSSNNKYHYLIPNVLSGTLTVFTIAMRNRDPATLPGGRDEIDSIVGTKFTPQGWAINMGSTFAAAGSQGNVSFTTDGTATGLFVNGIKQVSNTSSDNELTTGIFYRIAVKCTGADVGTQHRIGNTEDLNNYYMNGKIVLVYEWNRELSNSEIVYLSNNPYVFIIPPRRYFYQTPTAVVSTSTNRFRTLMGVGA